jgi:prepilin-type N-terminal cleavage/methylation domain-containing protein
MMKDRIMKEMTKRMTYRPARGFSLVELMIAMVIGLVVMGAATSLFKTGMDATMMITEQAEMQQNVRAAVNLISKDISMAGAGLPAGGVQLPYGSGATAPKIACYGTTCYLAARTYPSITSGSPPTTITNHMYGLVPGPNNGMENGSWTSTIPATGATPDSITTFYVDYSFPLNDYTITFPASPDGSYVNVGATPTGDPAILSPTGLQVGDLILLSNGTGSAVGEITTGGLTATKITFANGDSLNINQTGAANGNIKAISGGTGTKAYRIYAVTYFVEVPASGSGQNPRLMRQVNGQQAQPVADNIIDLQITYDACDGTNTSGTPACAALGDPIGNTPSYAPSSIHKVNLQVIGQSVLSASKKSVSMALVSSVSTRNLSFKDRFN